MLLKKFFARPDDSWRTRGAICDRRKAIRYSSHHAPRDEADRSSQPQVVSGTANVVDSQTQHTQLVTRSVTATYRRQRELSRSFGVCYDRRRTQKSEAVEPFRRAASARKHGQDVNDR